MLWFSFKEVLMLLPQREKILFHLKNFGDNTYLLKTLLNNLISENAKMYVGTIWQLIQPYAVYGTSIPFGELAYIVQECVLLYAIDFTSITKEEKMEKNLFWKPGQEAFSAHTLSFEQWKWVIS